MRKFPRRASVVLAAAAVSAGVTLGAMAAGTAGAATTTVTATTQVTGHPDTTSGGSGTACTSSANGPAWAHDTYASTLTAVQTATDTWRVTVNDNGSFAGFADPANCNALVSKGSFLFLYTVTVTSPTAPVPSDLKASYTTQSTPQMVADFFGGIATSAIAGGDYFADYQNGAYVQTTSGQYGDVTAYVAPQVTVPNVVGKRATAALNTLRAAGFSAHTSPVRNPAKTYVVTGTSPAAGSKAAKGSTVIVHVKVS
jgi:PASTA domain